MLEWNDLGSADDRDGNPISIANALGYCLRVRLRSDGLGQDVEALSILGVEFIGFGITRQAGQQVAETWLKRKAKDYSR